MDSGLANFTTRLFKRALSLLETDADAEALLAAPCVWCEYNGRGYWQEGTHDQWCPFHKIGGIADRVAALKNFV